MNRIQEGKAIIEIPEDKKISKKLEVFYNPVMKLNRDITILLLNAIKKNNMQVAEIMAGTGIRSIRIAKELKKGKVSRLCVNDHASIDNIKKNFKLNKAKAEFYSIDANEFLLKSSGFDYIDVDPFGTPNDFLDASIKRIARDGIIGVTATDTAVLCGTYPDAELRNYWSYNFRNGFMHESALRILARKVQMIGSQYNKALIPIVSYAREHYVRIFFKCIKSKKEADKLLKQHKYIHYDKKTLSYNISDLNYKKGYVKIGPLFVGTLNDATLINVMLKEIPKNKEWNEATKLLSLLHKESDIVGSYDLHDLARLLKIKVPEFGMIQEKAMATRVHYNVYAIKTRLSIEELMKIMLS